MNSIGWTTVGAFVCGVLAHAALEQWLPEIDKSLLSGVVGLAALSGAVLFKAIALRLTRGRSAGRT